MTKKSDENLDKTKNPGGASRGGGKPPQKKSDRAAEHGLKETTRVATDAAKTATDALKSGASDLADQTRDTAEQTAQTVGDAMDRVGDSLRSAASSLQDGSLHERTFGQLAQGGLADVSDAIREQDLKDLGSNVRDFARRNPLLFAGAAVLLGYSLSRMISNDRGRS